MPHRLVASLLGFCVLAVSLALDLPWYNTTLAFLGYVFLVMVAVNAKPKDILALYKQVKAKIGRP
mgnify:CR=1 FL=1